MLKSLLCKLSLRPSQRIGDARKEKFDVRGGLSEGKYKYHKEMSVTMSADAHTQMTNHINALGSEVAELKKQIKSYWEVDDECGGVGGTFPDIASHLRECYADKERMRKRYVQRNKEANELKKEVSRHRLMAGNLDEENKSLKKSNKHKTKIIHRFRKQVKELQEELEEANDVPNTHGVSIIYEDGEEEEELFWLEGLAEKYYYECVAKHKGSKTQIFFYSVPEEYDGGCESFKDAWLIRAYFCDSPEEE